MVALLPEGEAPAQQPLDTPAAAAAEQPLAHVQRDGGQLQQVDERGEGELVDEVVEEEGALAGQVVGEERRQLQRPVDDLVRG